MADNDSPLQKVVCNLLGTFEGNSSIFWPQFFGSDTTDPSAIVSDLSSFRYDEFVHQHNAVMIDDGDASQTF